MTVQELISELQEMPPTAEVWQQTRPGAIRRVKHINIYKTLGVVVLFHNYGLEEK